MPSPSQASREAGSGAAGSTQVKSQARPAARRSIVPLSALLSGRRWRHTARGLGLAIFCIGAILLAYVFWQALSGFQNFSRPDYLSQQFARNAGSTTAAQIQSFANVIANEVLRVLYLLLLGFIASSIAAKGIQFFSASEAVIDEAVAAGLEEEEI